MKQTAITLLIIALYFFCSCNSKSEEKPSAHPDWKQHQLPNGWSFWAPPEFRSYEAQGIDSEPGFIISEKDSIHLQFDSGVEFRKTKTCDFSNDFAEARKDIRDGFYKEFYKVPTVHSAYIDTIDNRVAIVVKPTKTMKGTVGVSIKDCETGAWLGIDGENLSQQSEALVLSIFKTIKFNKNLLRQ